MKVLVFMFACLLACTNVTHGPVLRPTVDDSILRLECSCGTVFLLTVKDTAVEGEHEINIQVFEPEVEDQPVGMMVHHHNHAEVKQL